MKHLAKLSLLAILLIFASCQNEKIDDQVSQKDFETQNEDLILASDGEEDTSLIFDKNSENLVVSASNASYTYGHGDDDFEEEEDCVADIEGLEASLPDTVIASTTAKPGDEAYFNLEITDGFLAGTDIPAWCVDVDLSLGIEGPLSFDVYSSYEELPEGKFENPQNFDKVNWILNQSFIGQESPSGGTYTFGHVQWAIWELIDNRNCQSCTYLTNPTGDWQDDPNNVVKGQEIYEAALENGEGFVPSCGELMGIVLVPDGKQSIMITKVVEPVEEECNDCIGGVTELELEFQWWYAKHIKVYQKYENTYYAVKVFDGVVQPGETFSFSGVNSNGTFGNKIYIYLNGYYYTKIKTNCYINIGPGYTKGIFEVVSGESLEGGELCDYEEPDYNYCWRHWSCYGHNSCWYGYNGWGW